MKLIDGIRNPEIIRKSIQEANEDQKAVMNQTMENKELVPMWVYKSDRKKINIKRAETGQSQPVYIHELLNKDEWQK